MSVPVSLAQEALEELENIANADPSKWEPDVRDQFREWAQNRARFAAAKIRAGLRGTGGQS